MKLGIGVSKGIAIGKVILLRKEEVRFLSTITSDVEKEIQRLNKAIQISIKQLESIKAVAPKASREIMDCHILILNDPELKIKIENSIRTTQVDATTATQDALGFVIDEFEQMENEYISERALDLRDVRYRLKMNLLGRPLPNIYQISEPSIVVSDDISPSQIATMEPQKILGIITEHGGKTSHTAIMANIMGIPSIVGCTNISKKLKNGDIIAFDGETGELFINPTPEDMLYIKAKKQAFQEREQKLNELISRPTITKDNKPISLGANIGSTEGALWALEKGAEGVGLLRTEFLYLERESMPKEEEQYQAYKAILSTMGKRPVIARTLDIGGDKQPSYMKIPKEDNPFLGYRAIRLCLDNPEMFKDQLRALLRASVHGNLQIMYPMVSSIEELRSANKLLEEAKAELKTKNLAFDTNIKIGLTVETPAAALLAQHLAKEVDFFSIGTNDLIQYTTAVDRMNEIISHLYNPLNPAVISLIKHVIKEGHNAGIEVGICGEIAREKKLLKLLIGLGVDNLSMNMGSITEVREEIAKIDTNEAIILANEVLKCTTAEEISNILNK